MKIDTLQIAARGVLDFVNSDQADLLTMAELVDLLGDIKAVQDALTAACVPLREAIMPEGEVIGSRYRALAVETERRVFRTKDVQAEMGPAWYEARCTPTLVASLRVSPLKPHEVKNG